MTQSFHRLISFYKLFVLGFSTIMAPITKCLKSDKFCWTSETQNSFKLIKKKVTYSPCLVLLDFNRVFKVEFNASHMGISVVPRQEGKPITFFSEKLIEFR